MPASATFTLPEAVPERLYLTDDLLPDHFKVNTDLAGLNPGAQGDMQGVYTLDGRFYIRLQGAVYEVRRSSALNCWRIVDPASPHAFGQHALVRLDDGGEWQVSPRPGLAGGGGALGRLRRVEPTMAYQPPADGLYAIPAEQREALAAYVSDPTSSVFDDEDARIEGDSAANNALETFRGKREGLVIDAQAFHLSHPIGALPHIPTVPASSTDRMIIDKILEGQAGLVLGEVHSQVGAKAFLMRNLRNLRRSGVTTLYMEHLLGDFHQQDLATALHDQRLPERLLQWLKGLDAAHGLTGKTSLTYSKLVSVVSEAGIRVVPLDNLASAHTVSLEDPDLNLRQSMLNYHAYLRIENDSPGRGTGKWVALVGQTHANAYHGIAGLDQLLEVPTIRFEDMPLHSEEGIEPDPGISVPASGKQPAGVLKANYVYSTGSPFTGRLATDMIRPTGLLPHKSFRVRPSGDSWLLTIRLTDNQQTEVRVDVVDDRYHIDVPGLGPVNERRYDTLDSLIKDLKRYGFRLVA
ncbi:TPA: hypothetical protein ACKP22_005088 [Pseudomonas putida]